MSDNEYINRFEQWIRYSVIHWVIDANVVMIADEDWNYWDISEDKIRISYKKQIFDVISMQTFRRLIQIYAEVSDFKSPAVNIIPISGIGNDIHCNELLILILLKQFYDNNLTIIIFNCILHK